MVEESRNKEAYIESLLGKLQENFVSQKKLEEINTISKDNSLSIDKILHNSENESNQIIMIRDNIKEISESFNKLNLVLEDK